MSEKSKPGTLLLYYTMIMMLQDFFKYFMMDYRELLYNIWLK